MTERLKTHHIELLRRWDDPVVEVFANQSIAHLIGTLEEREVFLKLSEMEKPR